MGKNKTVQVGEVLTGDFQEKTLTFEMQEGFYIRGGTYALVKLEDFKELKSALTSCKMAMQAHPDCDEDSEFEDFVSKAAVILNEINN